jgi:hypothetical protein
MEEKRHFFLVIEGWIFFGIWSLEFEASASYPEADRVDPAEYCCAIVEEAGGSRPMKRSTTSRALVAAFLSAAFLWTLALSASPQLHERFHPDANRAEHTCAVTFVASGSYDHVAHTPAVSSPVEAIQFSTIPALDSQWVQSPFLGASVFEHAPPALA